MGFNDYDDDYYDNTEHDVDFYDVMDGFDGEDADDDEDDSSYYDESMDGDHESAFGSAGWGCDEYYNCDNENYSEDDW